jgi:hypothetical protein
VCAGHKANIEEFAVEMSRLVKEGELSSMDPDAFGAACWQVMMASPQVWSPQLLLGVPEAPVLEGSPFKITENDSNPWRTGLPARVTVEITGPRARNREAEEKARIKQQAMRAAAWRAGFGQVVKVALVVKPGQSSQRRIVPSEAERQVLLAATVRYWAARQKGPVLTATIDELRRVSDRVWDDRHVRIFFNNNKKDRARR